VLGRGDETAERFEASGFATLVEANSPDRVSESILALLEEPARSRATVAGHALADAFRWERVAAPLLVALREIEPQARTSGSSRQLRRTTSYYARRLVDRLLPSH
jgi:hypothetical protein